MDISHLSIKIELCKRSFFYFVKEFIGEIESNDVIWNWHIEYLCSEAEVVARWVVERKPKEYNLIVNIAPGTTKSTIFSRLLPVWIWILDPSRKIATSTINDDTTKEFATTSRDLIQSEKFKLYFPYVNIRSDKNEKHFYETVDGGRRFAFSTFGKKIGKHNDLIIEDDPHTHDELISEVKMSAVIRQFKNLQSRKTDKENTPYILIMQRLGVDDLTDYILKMKDKGLKVKNIVLPAEVNELVNPCELQNRYVNGLLDPIRLSKKVLDESKLLFGDRYDSEFLQNPKPSIENLMYFPIVKQDFDIFEVAQNCLISVSCADLKDEGSDSFAIIFTALYKKRIYILDVIYNFKNNDSNLYDFIEKTKTYKIHKTFVESNNQQSYIKTKIEPELSDFTDLKAIWTSDGKIDLMKSKSHYIKFCIFHNNHPNPEYEKAVEHLGKFPRNGQSKDDGIEDVLSKSLKFYSINKEYFEKLI